VDIGVLNRTLGKKKKKNWRKRRMGHGELEPGLE
jgi:hypothetical protein